jgi:RNA recognition motif-containing protein
MLRLFVVIPKHMTKDDLRKVFEKYGSIINIKVIVDKLTGENKGFAYISFYKASEAAFALEECDPSYKPKFAEPFSSKRHRDNEDAGPSSASLYGAVSPPYRQKVPSGKQHPSPSSNSNEHRPSPPPLLALPARSLSNADSNASSTLSPVSNSYHLLDINNERRLIVRCGMTITNYHISKLFDLVPNMEECSPLSLNTFNEHYFIVRYKSCQFATYAREKLHAFQFPDGEILSVQYYDEKIVNDLINQSQNGKYGDTSGIGQLIHQMSNLQGSQEEYVDYCNIPLPPKQKYASFDAPVAKTLQIMPQRPVSEDYIRDIFNRFGNLIDIRMINPQLCHVMFSDERSADTAMETMNGQEIALVRIRIIESDKSVDSTTASVVHRKRQKV